VPSPIGLKDPESSVNHTVRPQEPIWLRVVSTPTLGRPAEEGNLVFAGKASAARSRGRDASLRRKLSKMASRGCIYLPESVWRAKRPFRVHFVCENRVFWPLVGDLASELRGAQTRGKRSEHEAKPLRIFARSPGEQNPVRAVRPACFAPMLRPREDRRKFQEDLRKWPPFTL
jgi:hypothetical protein